MQGPRLSPGELGQEMLRRKGEVQREKEREKAKARAEKLKQARFCSVVSSVGGMRGGEDPGPPRF